MYDRQWMRKLAINKTIKSVVRLQWNQVTHNVTFLFPFRLTDRGFWTWISLAFNFVLCVDPRSDTECQMLEVRIVTSLKQLSEIKSTGRFTISKPQGTNIRCSKSVRLSFNFFEVPGSNLTHAKKIIFILRVLFVVYG